MSKLDNLKGKGLIDESTKKGLEEILKSQTDKIEKQKEEIRDYIKKNPESLFSISILFGF